MNELWERFEKWFLSLPEPVAIALSITAVAWSIITGMQFLIGLSDAPKHKSMTRIEFILPGYQIGLWAGTRVNGENPINQ